MNKQKRLFPEDLLRVRTNQVYEIPPILFVGFMFIIEEQSKAKGVKDLKGRDLLITSLDISKDIDYLLAKRVLVNSINFN